MANLLHGIIFLQNTRLLKATSNKEFVTTQLNINTEFTDTEVTVEFTGQ